jgi:hypothetical protein
MNTFVTTGLPTSVTEHAGGRGMLYIGTAAGPAAGREVLVVRDAHHGLLLRHVDAALGVPLIAPVAHETQTANAAYSALKQRDAAAHRQHVYRHYVARDGQPPSSASRALWGESASIEPVAGDIRLTPYVMVMHALPARSVTGGAA